MQSFTSQLNRSVVIKRNHSAVVYFFLILSALLIQTSRLQAQPTNVTIKVLNQKKEPIPFSTVKVLQLPDSINKLQKVTDSTGAVVLTLSKGMKYLISTSPVSYAPVEKGITVTTDQPTFILTAEPLSRTLHGVTVTASKPLVRQEDDKTIVDPEPLATSSTNAYEILEKTPGLFVDQDGKIYLSSTTPATIYINGREQKMGASDVATMLKSLPPNSIASIEIMRTPSARYDASGSGGIVNVVLKKGVRVGLTGSVNAGLNQGTYGNRFMGITLNNSAAATTYINMQYSRRETWEQIKTDRLFTADSLLSQDAFTKYPSHTYYLGYGAGYQLNKQWEINYDGRFSYNDFINTSTNQSAIRNTNTENQNTGNVADVRTKGNSYNLNQAVSAKYKLDTVGSEWTTDLSYTFSPNRSNQLFSTAFYLPVPALVGGDGDIDNRLHFFSAQTNLKKKMAKEITIETGIKSTLVWFRNSTDYFRQRGSTRTIDAIRTGAYRYNEGIHAAYLQASKNISGITIKVGSRVENTQMRGRQLIPRDTTFSLHRTDPFPYVYISRSLMKIASYELRAYLVFRRTINRPAYEQLNPSLRFIDQYLYETGNPSLRPQFTKNYEANISVEERPIFAIGVNDTKDIFTNVIYQADSSRSVAFRTYDNLGSNKETYFRILGAIPPGKKYFFVAGGQYNHNFYRGLYENKPLSFKKGSWTLFSYQSFKPFSNTQITLSGFVRFNGQLQFYELSTFGALNSSINRQFLNKKLMVSLSVSDLFFTNNNHFTLQQGTVNAKGFRKGDTRRFGVNFRYNFGLRKKEENNPFSIESPEKSDR